jgi:tetratricopeptide (TPR) repeat protein
MRKLSASLIISAICGLFAVQPVLLPPTAIYAQEEEVDAASREGAEILFEEALELKKSGNLAGAVDSFARAIRMDRSILANDDEGLIEALKKDCEDKLKAAPEDVKVLELLGFVHAVCYSDYPEAIACYQKVYALVSDRAG